MITLEMFGYSSFGLNNMYSLSLKGFFTYVENQFNTGVKQIRSDHRTEFFNATLFSFFLDKGVLHQASCVGTPAQMVV